MKSIGIDIGTTSICGVLLDCDTGDVLNSITLANDSFIKTENEWERIQDAAIIWQRAKSILDDLSCSDVQSIGVTGQMHGIVYLNENGDCISPLYTWQDGRGDLSYNGSTYAKAADCPTGYGNATHFYNELNGLVPRDAAYCCTIGDYIALRLCNARTHIIHTSNAASLGNRRNPLSPEISNGTDILGYHNNIPVSIAIGDNQASFIGSGCTDDSVLVNVGTGSQISLLSQKEVAGLESRPLYSDKRILVGCSLCGGRAYALLESFFRQVAEMATGQPCGNLYAQMNQLLQEPYDTDVTFTNAFSGTRLNPNARGTISNLSPSNLTPHDFILACLKGIAQELHDFYTLTNANHRTLIGTGNGIRRNPTLQRIFKQTFGLNLKIPINNEEAATGAALFAMLSIGKNIDGLVKYE